MNNRDNTHSFNFESLTFWSTSNSGSSLLCALYEREVFLVYVDDLVMYRPVKNWPDPNPPESFVFWARFSPPEPQNKPNLKNL